MGEPLAFCQFNEIETRRGRVLGMLGRTYEARQTLADVIRSSYVLKTERGPKRFNLAEINARVWLAEVLRQAGSDESAAVAASAAREWQQLLAERPDTASYTSGLYDASDLNGFLAAFPQQRATALAGAPTERTDLFDGCEAILNIALGVNLVSADMPKAACEHLQKFVAVDSGGDSWVWFHLAIAHAKLGNDSQAQKMYQQAAKWMESNKPDNEELIALRELAATELGIANESDPAETSGSGN